MEERVPGESGYREWCIWLIEAGLCACNGCGGHLEGQTCRSCGCQHWVQEPTQHVHQRYASWTPNTDGRCQAGTKWLADWDEELDRQAELRRRMQAG